jgi:hypothetical protein
MAFVKPDTGDRGEISLPYCRHFSVWRARKIVLRSNTKFIPMKQCEKIFSDVFALLVVKNAL